MKRNLIVFIVLFVAASAVFGGGKKESEPEPAPEGSMMMSADLPMYRRVDFSNLDAALPFAAEGPTVLFFHASWCPTCNVALKDFMENGSAVASDITVVVVDYDDSAELKQRYGVTYQHTYVQIDGEGNQIKKWNGGSVDMVNRQVERG